MATLLLLGAATASALVISNENDPRQRAKAMLSRMTLDEKLTMLHGVEGPYIGNVKGIQRLGIPPLNLNDGPQGFRSENASSTAFPCGLGVAASWDPEAMFKWGEAMGAEFRAKGSNVQLGPGVCIARVPVNGRNFEYVSGEDPYLGYRNALRLVEGIQSQGVIANAKHWVNNNQEADRMSVDEEVSERTRYELYYPPFEGAIKAGVGSFMCSYNKVIGTWACENDITLNRDLKGKLGFQGWVMSDWGATHSTSIAQGLDQEMPGDDYFGDSLMQMVKNGTVTESMVDDSVLRMLTPMYELGIMDDPEAWDPQKANDNVTSAEHVSLARDLATQGTILLQNENKLLPLSKKRSQEENSVDKQTIAVVGTACHSELFIVGLGSGEVKPVRPYLRTPFQGITEKAGDDYEVVLIDTDDPTEAKQNATGADYILVCGGASATEGEDRANLSLASTQDALISALATIENTPVIVALSVGGAILTPWANDVEAILLNFFPGIQYGYALADVIFGEVSPGGRLPLTMPNKENEVGFGPEQYPGVDQKAVYSEHLLVGYRWYLHNDVVPKFCFGHGLSYSQFEYSGLEATSEQFTFIVTNTGDVAASDVPQLYFRYPDEANEPPLQLRRFEKVFLQPKQSQKITWQFYDRDFSIYSEEKHDWQKVSGQFEAHLGASVGDIRLAGKLQVSGARSPVQFERVHEL